MAKVDPFRSANPTDPDVYHNCSGCVYGQAIPARHVITGKGKRRQCPRCQYMAGLGNC